MLSWCVYFIIFGALLFYCLLHPVLSLASSWVSSKFHPTYKRTIGWIASLCRPLRLEFAKPGTFPTTGLKLATQD